MTTRKRWDEMRSLIEAGQRYSARCQWCGYTVAHPCYAHQTAMACQYHKAVVSSVPIDTKQAQHDGSRQIYGGLGTPQREGD